MGGAGSLAAAAHGWPGWTGGGSDPGEIWRVVRLSKDLSACPPVRGEGLARSGHDLVGALACQHRECIVCRFWPEPLWKDGSPRGGGSCPRMGLLFSVGLIPIGIRMWGRWWMALVGCWVRSRSQRRHPGIGVWSPGSGRRVIWFGSGWKGQAATGAGLARYLTAADIEVVEVNRPNRQLRRQRGGKSDSVDAEAPARAAASGETAAVPKSGDGPVECPADAVGGPPLGDEGPHPGG